MDEKTEEPTAKKREDAFKQGNFARSAEVGLVGVMAGAYTMLAMGFQERLLPILSFAKSTFSNLHGTDVSQEGILNLLKKDLLMSLYTLGPILGLCSIGALLAGGLQTGFKLTQEALSLKWERINPIQGFQRWFSSTLWYSLLIEGLKFLSIGVLLYYSLTGLLQDPLFSVPVSVQGFSCFLSEAFLRLMGRLLLALSFIAILTYLYQWHKTTKDLRMTRQEVKEEYKQAMGDPLLKSIRKRLAFQLLQKQLLQKVPTADVIITNPTHYAIALKYEYSKDQAPIVLAKGKNRFAERIKALGKQYEVPMVENKPTARLLYKLGKVGSPIPADLYRVVAEILSYVYKTHKYYFFKLKARRQAENSIRV